MNGLKYLFNVCFAIIVNNYVSHPRDDIRTDSKQYLEVILTDYNLCPEDIDKIWEIIKKKNPLRAIAELPRWVLHILNQEKFLFTSNF